MGHGFIGYPKDRNVERALGPSCPCILCIPIHIITINIEPFLGCHTNDTISFPEPAIPWEGNGGSGIIRDGHTKNCMSPVLRMRFNKPQ